MKKQLRVMRGGMARGREQGIVCCEGQDIIKLSKYGEWLRCTLYPEYEIKDVSNQCMEITKNRWGRLVRGKEGNPPWDNWVPAITIQAMVFIANEPVDVELYLFNIESTSIVPWYMHGLIKNPGKAQEWKLRTVPLGAVVNYYLVGEPLFTKEK